MLLIEYQITNNTKNLINTNITLESCNLCGSTDATPLAEYADSHLYRCAGCSFVYSNVIPSADQLAEIYKDKFNHTTYFSPITQKRYEFLLDDFESFRKTNRILDVGAGFGFFMQTAKARGWDVQGIEISDLCIEECEKKGLSIIKGLITELELAENQFDVIVGLEIIEHVCHPKELLQEMHRLLRKGGLLYVTTPNFNAINRYRLKKQYDVIAYPIHLCYFTPKTLRRVANTVGFDTKKIRTTGYSITRARTSKGKSNQEYVSETSDDEMLRQRMENKPLLRFGKKLINGLLNLFKVGDSLKGHFVKP